MTLRAKPVARRRGRAGWDAGDRRNNLINLGFFVAISLSVLILVGYAAYSWYDDHFGAAASVNGQVITKDQLRNRLQIEDFNLTTWSAGSRRSWPSAACPPMTHSASWTSSPSAGSSSPS